MRKETYFILFLCLIFVSIGVLLSLNEIYEDEWYIESSADGLFGRDNISLMTLCSNYIITGLIYLLSLTGIRLNWYLIIMLFFEYVTFILVLKSLISKWGIRTGIILSCLFALIIIPPLYRIHMLTNSSAFLISGGCFWLFDCIKNKRKLLQSLWGYVLILIGFSMRNGVVYFSIFFFGILWLMDVIPILIHNKDNILLELKHHLLPFAIVFIIMFVLGYSQSKLMEMENPGFNEWNSIRSQVDVYPIPSYKQHETEYKKIGISNTDYNLLRSVNNQDPEFFTQEKYKKIIELKNKYSVSKTISSYSLKYWIKLLLISAKGFFDNTIAGIWFIIILYSLLYKDKKLFFKALILIIANIILIAYFNYIGRFIQRIEWSIWINVLFVILLLQPDIKFDTSNDSLFKEQVLWGVLLVLFLFGTQVPKKGAARWNDLAGKNIYKQYRYVFALPNNYYHYVLNELTEKKKLHYGTHNVVIEDILKDKSSFYFVLLSQSWLLAYPLPGENIFSAAEIGTASNWGALGEYQSKLSPMRKNYSKYDIKNPFRDIVNDNIKIVGRRTEAYDRTYEIYNYVKEHYHQNVCFSIYEKIDDIIIGRYMTPNIQTQEVMEEKEREINMSYGNSSIDRFFSISIDGDYRGYKEKYLRILDSKGNDYIFTFEKNKNITTFYKELINPEEKYLIEIILKDEKNNYSLIKSNRDYIFKEYDKLKKID